MNPIALPLRALLDELDFIESQHEELSDTLSREALAEALHQGFLAQQLAYELPADFGLFTQEGNDAVRAALAKFLQATKSAVVPLSPVQRLETIQDPSVRSARGSAYDEHFGHVDAWVADAWAPTPAYAAAKGPVRPWWRFWR